MNDEIPAPRIVLCIPGPWKTREEFVDSIAGSLDADEKYVFAGKVLMHMGTGAMFEVQLQSHDERMARAFSAVGSHWMDSEAKASIDAHGSVAYLVADGGSDERVQAAMLAGRALLEAGGLGVKVESSGVAHSPDHWRRMCGDMKTLGAYKAFVVVVTGEELAHSCGLHAFGLHDVLVTGEEPAAAARVAQAFSRYLYLERPAILDGQTFAASEDAPRYRISASPGVDYGDDELYPNPYGTWNLTRL